MAGTYVTNLRHFLDEHGELADMPTEARQLASFLALIVDAVTVREPVVLTEIALRCRTRRCTGRILARLDPDSDTILWQCPLCERDGVISNWRGTKWDQSGGG